jgi:hypothetical protein
MEHDRADPGVYRVHELAARVFIPNPNNLPEVRHTDGNIRNNALENPEWWSHEDNTDLTRTDTAR